MGFRSVIVSSRSKLEYSLGFLIVRSDKEKRIRIDEINTLIIQSTAVSLTASLLCELSKQKVKVIFCDEKCDPYGEIIGYHDAHNSSKRIQEQLAWNGALKDIVWQYIIKEKIKNQANILKKQGHNDGYLLLTSYIDQVEPGDSTGRESFAAKVYFNDLFGPNFTRRDESFINKCLNYGYSILLAAFNRSIVASGYLTQLGIKHCNEFNHFNLSCDFIEPFRPFVDETILSLEKDDEDFKKKILKVLGNKCYIKNQTTAVENAIEIYLNSIYNCFRTGEIDISFPSDYEF